MPIIRRHRPLPDWSKVREERARRDHHVTLALLWTEYKAEHPDGYQYSQFVDLYRRFEKKLSVVLRQRHRAGEKVFVDFCDGIAMIAPDSGELVRTQLFVRALGASSYTFAIATLSQALPVRLDCHVRMYESMGGVAALTIPTTYVVRSRARNAGLTRPARLLRSAIVLKPLALVSFNRALVNRKYRLLRAGAAVPVQRSLFI